MSRPRPGTSISASQTTRPGEVGSQIRRNMVSVNPSGWWTQTWEALQRASGLFAVCAYCDSRIIPKRVRNFRNAQSRRGMRRKIIILAGPPTDSDTPIPVPRIPCAEQRAPGEFRFRRRLCQILQQAFVKVGIQRHVEARQVLRCVCQQSLIGIWR